jgi:hypothetical protein
MLRAPEVVIEAHEHYNKQSYRNRAFIHSAQGAQALSIPVEKGYRVKCPIREVRLSDHGEWRHQHLVAWMSNYGNSPFYEYYIDELSAILQHPYTFLFDLNEALRQKVCELIGFTPNVRFSTEYVTPTPEMRDLRESIHPKRSIEEALPELRVVPYYQVFRDREPFQFNLSILDLLFNMGPESLLVLRQSLGE